MEVSYIKEELHIKHASSTEKNKSDTRTPNVTLKNKVTCQMIRLTELKKNFKAVKLSLVVLFVSPNFNISIYLPLILCHTENLRAKTTECPWR